MKPLLSPQQDNDSLQALGRASLQIVHDLKNQLNGLKLYATFLRKRMGTGNHPADEIDTVNKLIGGLDRAAADLSTLTEFGRPIELRKQSQVDLHKIMRAVASGFTEPHRATGSLTGVMLIDSDQSPLIGEFDPAALTEALTSISVGAMKLSQGAEEKGTLKVSMHAPTPDSVEIEWHGVNGLGHDPFRSFAGSMEIRMSVAAKTIEAHGGSVAHQENSLKVNLPLTT